MKLTDLKEVMTKWQDTMHECDGWNSLYWSNMIRQGRYLVSEMNQNRIVLIGENAGNDPSYDAGNSVYL